MIGVKGKLAIDYPEMSIPDEAVGLGLGTDDGSVGCRQVESGPESTCIGAAASCVKLPEHSPAERGYRVAAPSGELRLSPEIVPIDIAMAEIHRALVRLVMVLARYVGHWKGACDSRSPGAP